jgi:hypothetical protein
VVIRVVESEVLRQRPRPLLLPLRAVAVAMLRLPACTLGSSQIQYSRCRSGPAQSEQAGAARHPPWRERGRRGTSEGEKGAGFKWVDRGNRRVGGYIYVVWNL